MPLLFDARNKYGTRGVLMIMVSKLARAGRLRIFASLVGVALAVFGGSNANATTEGAGKTCTSLGSSYTIPMAGGDQVAFNFIVAEGDVISVISGTIFYNAPGTGSGSASSPATITVSAANAGSWRIQRPSTGSTIGCTLAPTMSGPTESDNLDAQQDALSSLLMLHHANTMRIGVEENVNGAVGNGTATANYADQHGFYYSSRNADRADRAKVQGMLGYLDGDDASGIGDPMWNVWIKGRYSYYDGDGNAFDGYVADIFGGIDYKLSSSVVVGALTGYGRTDFDTITSGTAGGFEADGFTIGGYAGIGFGGGVTLNAMLAYTGSQYDNRSGTTTGSFDADRVTVAASLRGRHEMANGWTLVPVLDFLLASESQDAYTDSAAVAHASQTVTAGRVSAGPRILFPEMPTSSGYYRFWAGAMGEYDFSNTSPVPSSGLPDLGDVGSLRVSGGLDSRIGEGTLSLRADIFGIGSGEFTAYGGTLGYELPF